MPYDGANPEFEDLYHFPAEPDDTGWYSTNPRWQQQWYNEIKELVDNYHPDLLYTDGGVPFGNDVGYSMIAHLYNDSAARNQGLPQVVYTCKQKSGGRWVEDLERGIMPKSTTTLGRPTLRLAIGFTTAIGSSVRSAGSFICWWTTSARTAISY